MRQHLPLLLLSSFAMLGPVSGTSVQASPPIQVTFTDRELRVEAEVTKWTQSLNLTEAQSGRMRSLMLEQEAQSDEDRAQLERAQAFDEERLQQEHAEHMLAYDERYDLILEPWQHDRALSLGLYHEHRRFLRGLWIRWWWWPWWPGHHQHPGWHGYVPPPPHPRWPVTPPRRPLPTRPERPREERAQQDHRGQDQPRGNTTQRQSPRNHPR